MVYDTAQIRNYTARPKLSAVRIQVWVGTGAFARPSEAQLLAGGQECPPHTNFST